MFTLIRTSLILLTSIAGMVSIVNIASAQTIITQDYRLQAEVIIDGLNHPWALEWLGDNQLIVSERNADLMLIEGINKTPITLPATVFRRGQGGVLDVKKHPDYDNNGWIYLTYAASHQGKATTALARFKLNQNNTVSDWQLLFEAEPWLSGSRHFGSRIAFDDNHHIYLSVGDRGERHFAQQLDNQLGKVIRLDDAGRVLNDAPFEDNPAIFSYGNRNIQGMVWFDGQLFTHEHGPRGGDEFNLVTAGG